MNYCLKATLKLYGAAQLPCPDCPLAKLINPETADQVCLTSCTFRIMEELLDNKQMKIYARRHLE